VAQYSSLIPQNTALSGSRRIGIYNSKGNRVGFIPLGNLTPPDRGKKLYSFGALSDGHYPNDTSAEDYARALSYFHDELDLPFSIVCGDVTEHGTAEEWSWWRNFSLSYPVYVITGNHDGFTANHAVADVEAITGFPFYYSFTQGDDVFIMLGCTGSYGGDLFIDGELQWLYETLEANRNKRCFVFFHVRPDTSSGNALGGYKFDIYSGTETTVFESLLSHYKNVVFFHGHSHMKFNLQTKDDFANYKLNFGRHDIHIPSSTEPRNTDGSTITNIMGDSEGYVVDVYENGIHLRGRDFVKGEYLPIASYWLDTTLKTVPMGTYKDSTGTIDTSNTATDTTAVLGVAVLGRAILGKR
jgi:predicted phosphodiesterase